MKRTTPKFALAARRRSPPCLALAALLAACESKLPTQSDVAQDGRRGRRAVAGRRARWCIEPDSVKYVIDGKMATAHQATSAAAEYDRDGRRAPQDRGRLDTIYSER